MSPKHFASKAVGVVQTGLVSAMILQLSLGSAFAAATPAVKGAPSRDKYTSTPIKQVIVIIGENRRFAHVFATYVPKTGE